MKLKISIIAMSMVLFLSAPVFAKEKKEVQLTPTSHVESDTVDVTAKVKSIDQSTRHLELEGPTGNVVAMKVSDEVKNFKQIKKGDDVNVKYNQSLTWFVRKKGDKVEPTKTVSTEKSTAAVGAKPALDQTKTVNLIATVEEIDKKIPAVTLKGPEGKVVKIKVKDPENLKEVKVGDQVDITYSESVAMNVEKAKKK